MGKLASKNSPLGNGARRGRRYRRRVAPVDSSKKRPNQQNLAMETGPIADQGSDYAHYSGVGHILTMITVTPIEMPADHWGVWPKNWKTGRRKGERVGEPWPPRSDSP